MKPLLLCFLIALCSFSLAAETPEFSPFAGLYEGFVINEGSLHQITTTLTVSKDGYLSGRYSVLGEAGNFNGTLSNPRLSSSNTLSFEWTDRHGEGYEVLVFADDFNSFTGFWGDRNSEAQYLLTGERK